MDISKRLVFMLPDMKSDEYAFFVMFMSHLAEKGTEIYAMTNSKSTKEDFRYSPKIKRLPLNAPIKRKYTRYQVLDFYVHQLEESLFIILTKDYEKELRIISQKHKAIYLDNTLFVNPVSNEALAKHQMEALRSDLNELPLLECDNPGLIEEKIGIMKKIKGFVRHREEKRHQKYTYIQLTDEEVRKSQQAAISMLWEFKRICEKYKLKYYLAAGSLLGAARSGGFIPWDDDIDVTMPRKDYEKFLKIARKELDKRFVLPRSNFPYGFQRMQVRGTNIERYVRQRRPHGIFMDILPLDCAPTNEEEKKLHKLANERLTELMFDISYPQPILAFNRESIRKWTKRLFRKIFCSKRKLMKKWKENATRYNSPIATEWVCLPGMVYPYEKECFPIKYWGDGTTLEFEGEKVKVMCEWEKYLTSHYGDYTEEPPELLRRTHALFSIKF